MQLQFLEPVAKVGRQLDLTSTVLLSAGRQHAGLKTWGEIRQ